MKVAIVRGKYLNKYEMQFYEPLAKRYQITAFGSKTCYHDQLDFPVVKLASPMDLPTFPFKTPILNRLMIDAQYLLGLENQLDGFDIVHTAETYLHFTHQCLQAKKQGQVKKVVATVFENIPFANEGIWGRTGFKKQALAELDHIVAISERSKQALVLEGYPEHKITVINQYIDTKRFKPVKRKSGKSINILFVGRLEIYKGVYEVIWAAKRLLTDKDLKDFKIKFILVGQGNEQKNLSRQIKRMNIGQHISFETTSYENMPKIYQQADIFLAPSRATRHWQEQFSTVLLEAQASGLAIVTTRSGAIEENVGQAALLVQPADFLSLYQAVKKLILTLQLRIQLSKKARARAVSHFDIKLGAKKLDQVYKRVINE